MNPAENAIQEALESPYVHNYAKEVLRLSEGRDIVDCINDLEYVTFLLTQKTDCALQELGCTRK